MLKDQHKSDLRKFSYGYRKCMFVDSLTEIFSHKSLIDFLRKVTTQHPHTLPT